LNNKMRYQEIIKRLKAQKNPKNVEGMARFGIRPKTKVYGISMPEIRKLAKDISKNHQLALELWESGIHEARILSGLIAEAEELTEKQMEKWVKDFDSWDICDQVCMNLFDKTKLAEKKIFEWEKRKEEFARRTAFSLMAALAVHNKELEDKEFIKFFPLIKRASTDERNFVRKAVNWALRQIGKRNKKLNKEAIRLAKEIQRINSKSARWIANDAIRELIGENVQKRLKT